MQTQVSAIARMSHVFLFVWEGGVTSLQREVYALFLGRKGEAKSSCICSFLIAFSSK